MKSIVVVGAGGSGRCVVDVIEKINDLRPDWDFLGFVDDDVSKNPICGLSGLSESGAGYYSISIANPRVRARADTDSISPAILVHPSAILANSSPTEAGLVVRANASVGPGVRFGRHNYVSMNATIGHDVRLHDYVTIHPGANVSGYVQLLEGVTLGAGSVVLPNVRVGSYAYVGAGSVVTRDVPDGATVIGAPARPR